jgi:hypothetical protein
MPNFPSLAALNDWLETRCRDAACAAAERDHPDTARFAYQLGLALARLKRYPEAAVRLREAAEAGYAPAEADLAYAITEFGVDGGSPAEAFRWSMRAAQEDIRRP